MCGLAGAARIVRRGPQTRAHSLAKPSPEQRHQLVDLRHKAFAVRRGQGSCPDRRRATRFRALSIGKRWAKTGTPSVAVPTVWVPQAPNRDENFLPNFVPNSTELPGRNRTRSNSSGRNELPGCFPAELLIRRSKVRVLPGPLSMSDRRGLCVRPRCLSSRRRGAGAVYGRARCPPSPLGLNSRSMGDMPGLEPDPRDRRAPCPSRVVDPRPCS